MDISSSAAAATGMPASAALITASAYAASLGLGNNSLQLHQPHHNAKPCALSQQQAHQIRPRTSPSPGSDSLLGDGDEEQVLDLSLKRKEAEDQRVTNDAVGEVKKKAATPKEPTLNLSPFIRQQYGDCERGGSDGGNGDSAKNVNQEYEISNGYLMNTTSKNKLGRAYNPGRPLAMEEREKILQLYQKGLKISHIAKLIGVTHSCVSKIMSRYRRTGSMNPRSAQAARKFSAPDGEIGVQQPSHEQRTRPSSIAFPNTGSAYYFPFHQQRNGNPGHLHQHPAASPQLIPAVNGAPAPFHSSSTFASQLSSISSEVIRMVAENAANNNDSNSQAALFQLQQSQQQLRKSSLGSTSSQTSSLSSHTASSLFSLHLPSSNSAFGLFHGGGAIPHHPNPNSMPSARGSPIGEVGEELGAAVGMEEMVVHEAVGASEPLDLHVAKRGDM